MAFDTPAVTPEGTHVSGRRFLAHVVDGIVYGVLLLVAILLCSALAEGALGSVAFAVVLVGWLTVGHVVSFVELQRRDGQTPGKRFAHIKVVDTQGRPPHHQRLGDRWGHTYVVAA